MNPKIILSLFVGLWVNSVWSYDPLLGFEQIIIPRVNCPYEDKSRNVLSLSDTTRTALKTLQSRGQDCAAVTQSSQEVENRMDEYFEIQSQRMGLSRRNEKSLEVNCQNYVQLFRWEFNNAMVDVNANRKIDGDNFFSNVSSINSLDSADLGKGWEDCNQFMVEEEDGDFKYPARFHRCSEDALARRLKVKRDQCDRTGKKVESSQMVENLRKDIVIQENVARNIRTAMKNVYSNLNNPDCRASDSMLKAALQSTVSLGSNLAGSMLGGSVGGGAASLAVSLGSEAINFVVDYMARKALELSKIGDMEKSENFENAACLFLSVQEADCKKYELPKGEPICKTKTAEEIQDEDKLKDNTKDIFDLIDEISEKNQLGEVLTPAAMDILKKTLEKFDIARSFPAGKEDTLRNILNKALDRWYRVENLRDYQQLTRYKEAIWKSEGLIKIWNSRFKDRGYNDFSKRDRHEMVELENDMKSNLQILSEQDLPNLLKGYIKSEILDTSGINRIMAEETAREIVSHIDNVKLRTEGDLRRLTDLTSAMVENFKGPFKERLVSRYRESFVDAYRAERNYHKKFNLSSKTFEQLQEEEQREVLKERQNTFRMLRNTVKDCLATSGVMFMRRKRQQWYHQKYFQAAANLLINRAPATYLKVCRPFLCNNELNEEYQGIPIPKLVDKETAPSDYGKYQCRLINNSHKIYDRMEQNYMKTGKICGKTIDEITFNGTTFTPDYNEIYSLVGLIQTGEFVTPMMGLGVKKEHHGARPFKFSK